MFRAKKNAEGEGKTAEQKKARITGLLQKEKEKRDRLKELEMDYTFPGYKAIVDTYASANKKAPKPAETRSSAKKDSAVKKDRDVKKDSAISKDRKKDNKKSKK